MLSSCLCRHDGEGRLFLTFLVLSLDFLQLMWVLVNPNSLQPFQWPPFLLRVPFPSHIFNPRLLQFCSCALDVCLYLHGTSKATQTQIYCFLFPLNFPLLLWSLSVLVTPPPSQRLRPEAVYPLSPTTSLETNRLVLSSKYLLDLLSTLLSFISFIKT